jgi:hypothetical protein
MNTRLMVLSPILREREQSCNECGPSSREKSTTTGLYHSIKLDQIDVQLHGSDAATTKLAYRSVAEPSCEEG